MSFGYQGIRPDRSNSPNNKKPDWPLIAYIIFLVLSFALIMYIFIIYPATHGN